MGLIKSEHAPARLKPFSMSDIEAGARQMLIRARRQAEELLATAQQEAEELKRIAHAEGLAEGRIEGQAKGCDEGQKSGHEQALNEGRAQLSELMTTLGSMVGQLDAARQDMEAAALSEVVALAVAIARRVTKRRGELDPQVLIANLSDAMSLVVHASDVHLVVHPSQRAILEATLPKLQMKWPNLRHVVMDEDESLAVGGCRITTCRGEVDADLGRQLDRIVAELMPHPGQSPQARQP